MLLALSDCRAYVSFHLNIVVHVTCMAALILSYMFVCTEHSCGFIQ